MKIRCPHCAKLYEVQSEDVQSETPLFQCISCETRFSFINPPADLQNVVCFIVETAKTEVSESVEGDAHQQLSTDEELHGGTKSCPKCGALNGRRSKECYSCHVIFEKLEGLPTDPTLRAQPSLVRKWRHLLDNFEKETLHDDFIKSCYELDALRFALMKYSDLKEAQGGDPQCDRMIARINALTVVGLSGKNKPVFDSAKDARPSWQKYLYWAPFVASFILITMGMINLGHRNLIGVGVALAFMSAGLIVMVRGKISLSDFIK